MMEASVDDTVAMTSHSSEGPPSFVRGRKGRLSVVDCLVQALWKTEADGKEIWPEDSFQELRERVTKMQGYRVTPSTIRSSVYEHDDLFERVRTRDGSLRWRLTKTARKG
jgi:hypothetical protein